LDPDGERFDDKIQIFVSESGIIYRSSFCEIVQNFGEIKYWVRLDNYISLIISKVCKMKDNMWKSNLIYSSLSSAAIFFNSPQMSNSRYVTGLVRGPILTPYRPILNHDMEKRQSGI
jgi:hypothetical protein